MVQNLKSKLWTSINFTKLNLELDVAAYLVNFAEMFVVF
jgi:hypothetical protein